VAALGVLLSIFAVLTTALVLVFKISAIFWLF